MQKVYTTSAKSCHGKILLELNRKWVRISHFSNPFMWLRGYFVGYKTAARMSELSRKGFIEKRTDPEDCKYKNYRLKGNLEVVKLKGTVTVYDHNHTKHFHHEQ